MKKLAIAFAGLAALGFSGVAFAEDATTGSWTTTTGPAAMSDSEMDKVTAAGNPGAAVGGGINTAIEAGAIGVQNSPSEQGVAHGVGRANKPQ